MVFKKQQLLPVAVSKGVVNPYLNGSVEASKSLPPFLLRLRIFLLLDSVRLFQIVVVGEGWERMPAAIPRVPCEGNRPPVRTLRRGARSP